MTTTYISFSSEINQTTTEGLLSVMAQQANDPDVDTVYLLFSTPGGTVMNCLNLYNMLKNMPFKLITHNVGNVDSIGNAVFLAGEERYACPTSTFMFHGVGYGVSQFRLEEKSLREFLDSVMNDHQRIGKIINERTDIDAEKAASLFREASTKDAQFALDAGIIHEIREPVIPRGNVFQLAFSR